MTYISWSSGFALYLEDYLISTSYFGIMSQHDLILNLKMSYFWKMGQCNMTFDLKINLGHSDLYFTVQ